MGTSNFYNKNASRIFAICMNYETPIMDDEGNETEEMETYTPDREACEDTIQYVKDKIAELPDSNGLGNDSQDRNFHGTNVGELWKHRTYLGFEVGVELQAYARSGYYEGANLDWEVSYIFEGDNFDDLDTLIEYFIDRSDDFGQKGLGVMQAKNVRNYLQKTEEFLVSEIEKVFHEVSEIELQTVARFSNGETMYRKVG